MDKIASLFFDNIKLKIIEFRTEDLTNQTWNYTSIESPFNRIYYIEKGYGSVTPDYPDSDSVRLEPGNIYLLPKNIRYRFECPEYMTQIYIHFNLEFINSHDLFQNFNAPLTIQAIPTDHSFFTGQLEDSSSLFSAYSYIAAIISRFVSSYPIDISEQLLVSHQYSSVFQYLNNQLSIQLDINELSEILSLSKSFLLKSFKRDIGCTVKQYNTRLIMQKAKELLYTSTLTIKEISYQLGFQDEFYFSKLFKKCFGTSPREYRKIGL